jgi:chromosome segregation ATPase
MMVRGMDRKCIYTAIVAFILGISAFVPVASSDDAPWGRRDPLDQSMSSFMDTVERLLAENKKYVDVNEDLRARIKAIRDQIRALKNEEVRLQTRMNKVDTHYQKRRGSVEGLQSSLADGVQILADLKNQQMLVEADLKSKEAEDGDFQNRLEALQKEIQNVTTGVFSGELGQHLTSMQSERSTLENTLVQSSNRIELLQKEWQSISVAVSAGGGQAKAFEKEQALLKNDLSRKEEALKNLRQEALGKKKLLDQLSIDAGAQELFAQKQSDLAALGLELETLQADVAALEEKTALLAEKEKGETPKRMKKEELLRDLTLRNTALRSELSLVQQEMVKLDKKKSILEKNLYKPSY